MLENMNNYSIFDHVIWNAIPDGIFIFNQKVSETTFLEYPYHHIIEILSEQNLISSMDLKKNWLAMLPNDLPLDIDTFYDNAILTLLQQQIIKNTH